MSTHGSNWLQASRSAPVSRALGPDFAHGACTVHGLNEQAHKLGFRLRRSSSLVMREDQSLRGVLVVMNNPGRAAVASLLARHFRPRGLLAAGDRVLAETIPGDVAALASSCPGVPLPRMFSSAGCYAIGHPQILGMAATLRHEARAKADGAARQEAVATYIAYVDSAETIRARCVHLRNRSMEHHRPDHATWLLLDGVCGRDLACWAMNPANRLDAVVVGAG